MIHSTHGKELEYYSHFPVFHPIVSLAEQILHESTIELLTGLT